MEEKIISLEDLNAIKTARTKAAILALKAEKALTEAQLGEAEYKNHILEIYIKYGIDRNSSIDETTGRIMLNKKVEEQ